MGDRDGPILGIKDKNQALYHKWTYMRDDFYQMDDTMFHFVLLPDDVIVSGGYGAPSPIRIVFDQSFGGNAYSVSNDIMFNLSPKELWIGEEKYEPFKQLVYHYEGAMDN